jgi:hypothetical protein
MGLPNGVGQESHLCFASINIASTHASSAPTVALHA